MARGSGEALRQLNELRTINLEGLRFRFIDAKGQVVGRLAEQISIILQGKDKPTYNPRKERGDVVIVANAAHVHLTHDKWNSKLYRWHTGAWSCARARSCHQGIGKVAGTALQACCWESAIVVVGGVVPLHAM